MNAHLAAVKKAKQEFCARNGIQFGAGKHYSELFKKWNGRGAAVKSLCGKNRYEVRFYTI